MSKTQIITGVERRRKFSDEEQAALAAEAANDGVTLVSRKHGIAPSALYRWMKKFPPKSFALVEVNEPKTSPANPPKPISPIDSQPQLPGMIRVTIQKRIVVEFPLTADPSAIAQFVKALEGWQHA